MASAAAVPVAVSWPLRPGETNVDPRTTDEPVFDPDGAIVGDAVPVGTPLEFVPVAASPALEVPETACEDGDAGAGGALI